jgi:hypothetical protein
VVEVGGHHFDAGDFPCADRAGKLARIHHHDIGWHCGIPLWRRRRPGGCNRPPQGCAVCRLRQTRIGF